MTEGCGIDLRMARDFDNFDGEPMFWFDGERGIKGDTVMLEDIFVDSDSGGLTTRPVPGLRSGGHQTYFNDPDNHKTVHRLSL